MSKFSAFVTDGYDEKAYIAEIPGIYDQPVEITFRPTTYTDQTAIIDRVNELRRQKQLEEADNVWATEIAARLQSWRFLDKKNGFAVMEGAPEPTQENLLRCKPVLFARLVSIIIHGSDGGDPDPRTSAQKGGAVPPKPAREKLAEKQGN